MAAVLLLPQILLRFWLASPNSVTSSNSQTLPSQFLPPLTRKQGHQRWVWDMAFSADGVYLISGSSDHTARLWDSQTGDALRHYSGHHKAVVAVALNDLSLAK